MLKKYIHYRLRAAEAQFKVPCDYLHHMVDTSVSAFFAFSKIFGISEYRRVLPLDAWHVGRIVATQAQDCGTCVQIAVNRALADGVAPAVLQLAVHGRVDELEEPLADMYRFVKCVVEANPDDDAERKKVRDRWGDQGLVELSLAVASSQFYPLVKRTLGYAKSCALVQIEV